VAAAKSRTRRVLDAALINASASRRALRDHALTAGLIAWAQEARAANDWRRRLRRLSTREKATDKKLTALADSKVNCARRADFRPERQTIEKKTVARGRAAVCCVAGAPARPPRRPRSAINCDWSERNVRRRNRTVPELGSTYPGPSNRRDDAASIPEFPLSNAR